MTRTYTGMGSCVVGKVRRVAQACMARVAVMPFSPGRIAVRIIKRDDEAYYALKEIPGHRWDRDSKVNVFPAERLTVIQERFPNAVLAPQLRLHVESQQTADKQRQLVEHIKGLATAEITGYQWPTVPYPHQTVGVAFLLSLDRSLMLDSMGLGKTLQAITTACVRMQRGLLRRCLILVPNSLKFNTLAEVMKHAAPEYRKVVVVDGDKRKRLAQLEAGLDARFTVINYESARLHVNELKLLVDGEMLVADEAHKIKNRNAQVTKAVGLLKPRYAVLMTGTPVANKVEDIFTLVDYVSPKLLGKNYWDFEDRFLKKGGWNGKEIMGYKNLDALREKLATVSIRRLKCDVLGLPPKTYAERLVEMGKEQTGHYVDMRDYLIAKIEGLDDEEFEAKATTILTQLLRLQQIADGYVSNGEQHRWVGTAKFDALDEIVDEVVRESGKKLVIWGRFIPVVKEIGRRYADLGAAMIYGAVPTDERQRIVDRFQDLADPLKIIVGQIQTASLGLTMTAADTEVFYDQSWSPAENLQAEDRLHRIGAKGSVTVVRLLAQETIDERMQRLLERKMAIAGFVSGDTDVPPIKFTKDEIMGLL